MAIVNRRMASIAGGAAFISVDVETTDNTARVLRWSNTLDGPVVASVTLPSGEQLINVSIPIPPGSSGSRNLTGARRWNVETEGAWPSVNLGS